MNAFNGEEIAGRKILVREDREDRDVKQFNKENGIERPNTRRPKRGGRGGVANGSARGEQGGRRGTPQETHQSSGLQASLCFALQVKEEQQDSPHLVCMLCLTQVLAVILHQQDVQGRRWATVQEMH